MFNVEELVEAISDESLEARLLGIESFKAAPELLQQLMGALSSIERRWFDRGPLDMFFVLFEEALCIFETRIPRNFSRTDANRGKTMTYHPITGDKISLLKLEKQEIHYGEFFWKGRNKLSQICNHELHKGHSYPKNWQFDPWTGEKLEES